MKRIFRGCVYDISIDNSAEKGNLVKEILVDGVKNEGSMVAPKGEKLQILVMMGD